MAKIAAAIIVALVFSALFFPAVACGVEPEGAVSFRWALVSMMGEADDRQVVPIVKDTMLRTGDRFKIFAAPEKGTFVYLIYRSSQNQIHLLYPHRAKGYDDPGSHSAVVIPAGRQWFQLDDHAGEEVFNLIAADRRLTNLEMLLLRHEKTEAVSERSAAAKQIQDEIRRLRWENRGFKTIAERPTAVMGQLRGVQRPPEVDTEFPDITDHAVRIEARGFYSRTYTIDHRQ